MIVVDRVVLNLMLEIDVNEWLTTEEVGLVVVVPTVMIGCVVVCNSVLEDDLVLEREVDE